MKPCRRVRLPFPAARSGDESSRPPRRAAHGAAALDWKTPISERDVEVPAADGALGAVLFSRPAPRAAVIRANPSSLARLRTSERFEAALLARAGFATLLIDLLTDDEDDARAGADLDVPLLAERTLDAARWLSSQGGMARLPLGYLGFGAAGPAALVAGAHDPRQLAAVVLGSGQPERAGTALLLSSVPALVIASSAEPAALAAARAACRIRPLRQLELVSTAPGALADGDARSAVTALASAWFSRWCLSADQ